MQRFGNGPCPTLFSSQQHSQSLRQKQRGVLREMAQARSAVLARRFAEEPGWRGWATYSVRTAILAIVLITVFCAQHGPACEIAGLFERLATSLGTLWGL